MACYFLNEIQKMNKNYQSNFYSIVNRLEYLKNKQHSRNKKIHFLNTIRK